MKTDNHKSTLKDIKYEFECPGCKGDYLLACFRVLSRNSFDRVSKITWTDKENNVVDTMYSCGFTRSYDLEDIDDPVVFSCQHCQKTWTSLEDMINEGIIKLID